MPIKDRDWKHEYKLQKARGKDEHENRMKRQKARRAYDADGIDRDGKHVAHVKALSNGGSNARSNTKLVAPSKNLAFARKSNHKPKK